MVCGWRPCSTDKSHTPVLIIVHPLAFFPSRIIITRCTRSGQFLDVLPLEWHGTPQILGATGTQVCNTFHRLLTIHLTHSSSPSMFATFALVYPHLIEHTRPLVWQSHHVGLSVAGQGSWILGGIPVGWPGWTVDQCVRIVCL